MGLMGFIEAGGLVSQVSGVFEFFRGVYDAFPVAVKLLITSTFGGMVYIAVMRSFKG